MKADRSGLDKYVSTTSWLGQMLLWKTEEGTHHLVGHDKNSKIKVQKAIEDKSFGGYSQLEMQRRGIK